MVKLHNFPEKRSYLVLIYYLVLLFIKPMNLRKAAVIYLADYNFTCNKYIKLLESKSYFKSEKIL